MGAGLTSALVWSLLLYVTMSKLFMLVRCSQCAGCCCCVLPLRPPRRDWGWSAAPPGPPSRSQQTWNKNFRNSDAAYWGRGRAGEGKVFITVGLHTSDTCHKSTSFVLYISTLISNISISPLLIASSLFCRMHSPSFFAYKPKIRSQIWSHI